MRNHYLAIVLTGLVLVIVSGYVQLLSMDLSKNSLFDYLKNDMRLLEWWAGIGLMATIGFFYLLVGVVFWSKPSQEFRVFVVCLVVGLMCLPFNWTLFFPGVLVMAAFSWSRYKGYEKN